MASSRSLLLLPGDGIGPEVMDEVRKIIQWLADNRNIEFTVTTDDIGGTAYDRYGVPLDDSTLETARKVDAIVMGSVGGPKWDGVERNLRPEAGLLRLRKELDLFANLRPATCRPALASASSLKQELVAGLDILIVRELTAGVYFGQPRGIESLPDGSRRAVDTQVYTESEIERIAHSAFKIAMQRDKRLCSVDKANVLEVSELWREVVTAVGQSYPEVELSHMYVDNACMQLVRAPKQFDVLVTTNMFGDIVSDAASMLTGSIGMLPSASLDANDKGMYEPVHGSAPDIAGQNIANPLATILSVAMMLRTTFENGELADRVEKAVQQVLADGLRTGDIAGPDDTSCSTSEMGDAVVAAL